MYFSHHGNRISSHFYTAHIENSYSYRVGEKNNENSNELMKFALTTANLINLLTAMYMGKNQQFSVAGILIAL